MKSLFHTTAVVVALVTPMLSFAQSNGPLTRAQVRNDLIQLELVGYNPTANDNQYPNDIQAAEGRLAAKRAALGSVGGVASANSQSGDLATSEAEWNAMYRGH